MNCLNFLNEWELKSIEIRELHLYSMPGANLRASIQEAILVSAAIMGDVVLHHNKREYHIKLDKLVACVSDEKIIP